MKNCCVKLLGSPVNVYYASTKPVYSIRNRFQSVELFADSNVGVQSQVVAWAQIVSGMYFVTSDEASCCRHVDPEWEKNLETGTLAAHTQATYAEEPSSSHPPDILEKMVVLARPHSRSPFQDRSCCQAEALSVTLVVHGSPYG